MPDAFSPEVMLLFFGREHELLMHLILMDGYLNRVPDTS